MDFIKLWSPSHARFKEISTRQGGIYQLWRNTYPYFWRIFLNREWTSSIMEPQPCMFQGNIDTTEWSDIYQLWRNTYPYFWRTLLNREWPLSALAIHVSRKYRKLQGAMLSEPWQTTVQQLHAPRRMLETKSLWLCERSKRPGWRHQYDTHCVWLTITQLLGQWPVTLTLPLSLSLSLNSLLLFHANHF